MKRKVLAALLVIAVFGTLAAAETAVLRNRVNADFGNVRDVYYYQKWRVYHAPEDEIKIENMAGDTNLLNITNIYGFSTGSGGRRCSDVDVYYDASVDIAFTTGYYKDGRILDEPVYQNAVYKLDTDGDWDWYSVPMYGFTTPAIADGSPVYPVLKKGESRYTILALPVCEPGRYKCCLYFRHAVSSENFHYETGLNIFGISFEYEIPEPSANGFDLATLTVLNADGLIVSPIIRANRGKPPYLDRADGKLERRTEDGWEDASNLMKYWPEELETRYSSYAVDDHSSVSTMHTEPLEPEGEYRMTLYYYENEDGTGKRYELILHLMPAEEPTE